MKANESDSIDCWTLRSRSLELGETPLIMGIVNVTPDSFSDGGRFSSTDRAIAHGLQLVQDGADILDIGGESTRPYSTPVDIEEELARVVDVVKGLAEVTSVPLSIDTSKARVAEAAIHAGAEIINDVTGLTGDQNMIPLAVESAAGICAMHMQGTPQTMQNDPRYEDVVEDILQWLVIRRDQLLDAGIAGPNLCLDPGIGFGKTHEHNLQLLAGIDRFHATGCPLLVGHSRKGFIKKFSGDDSDRRVAGTLAVSLHLANAGVHVIRVHDVKETRQGIAMWNAIHQI